MRTADLLLPFWKPGRWCIPRRQRSGLSMSASGRSGASTLNFLRRPPCCYRPAAAAECCPLARAREFRHRRIRRGRAPTALPGRFTGTRFVLRRDRAVDLYGAPAGGQEGKKRVEILAGGIPVVRTRPCVGSFGQDAGLRLDPLGEASSGPHLVARSGAPGEPGDAGAGPAAGSATGSAAGAPEAPAEASGTEARSARGPGPSPPHGSPGFASAESLAPAGRTESPAGPAVATSGSSTATVTAAPSPTTRRFTGLMRPPAPARLEILNGGVNISAADGPPAGRAPVSPRSRTRTHPFG